MDTTTLQGEDVEAPPRGEEEVTPKRTGFTSESAREAQRRSAEVRRARRDAERMASEWEGSRAADGQVGLVRVPVPIGAIIGKLTSKAQAGDATAAKELRAWLEKFPPDESAADINEMDGPTRAQVTAILVRALADLDEDAAHADIQDGTQDANGAALLAATPADHPESELVADREHDRLTLRANASA